MTKLTDEGQIWILKPHAEDIQTGARYAAITLPWTFDRMMKGSTSKSLQRRALNIAKGVVAQKALLREFIRRGIPAPEHEKSYRSDDLFDFRVNIDGAETKLDVKSINYYTNYDPLGREPLTPELIIKNAGYPGPDWRKFFPMLMPHTQIGQPKEAYCFAIASSIDFRSDIETNRDSFALTAFPYGAYCAFLSSSALTLAREKAGQGVYLTCEYKSDSLFGDEGIKLKILGEWDGEYCEREVTLQRGSPVSEIGPFSCVTSFQIEREDYELLAHPNHLEISVSRNDFSTVIRNYKKENVNVLPTDTLKIINRDFCNLVLPSDYTLYVLGWATREEYLTNCRKYSGWVWPNDKVNKYENQPWTRFDERDMKNFTKTGFDDCVVRKPPRLNAGWMKATPRGSACCYVFPNMFGGGLNETNLYVLPQDLHTMDSLGGQLKTD